MPQGVLPTYANSMTCLKLAAASSRSGVQMLTDVGMEISHTQCRRFTGDKTTAQRKYQRMHPPMAILIISQCRKRFYIIPNGRQAHCVCSSHGTGYCGLLALANHFGQPETTSGLCSGSRQLSGTPNKLACLHLLQCGAFVGNIKMLPTNMTSNCSVVSRPV